MRPQILQAILDRFAACVSKLLASTLHHISQPSGVTSRSGLVGLPTSSDGLQHEESAGGVQVRLQWIHLPACYVDAWKQVDGTGLQGWCCRDAAWLAAGAPADCMTLLWVSLLAVATASRHPHHSRPTAGQRITTGVLGAGQGCWWTTRNCRCCSSRASRRVAGCWG